MHTDVEAELRMICRTTLESFSARTGVSYSDDLALDVENQYMVVPSTILVAHRPESRRGRRAADAPAEPPQIEVDAGAREVLAKASSLEKLHASELKKQPFVFYAAVVGDDPDHRIAFVDKWNPYKAGMSGRLLTSFGDRLRRIDEPLLIFERSFDMVMTDDTIAVLNERAFEEVFRDIDSMVERIPVWSGAAVTALPLDDETAERFEALSAGGGRFAKQLRGMYERGVFERTITTTNLRTEMTRQKLDADRYIVDGKLALDDDDIPIVLKLIDEKLYQGWLTETSWDVDTRSKRSTG